MSARHLILLAVAAVALGAASPAAAATLKVTSQADDGPGSLAETILEAGPGDTIEIPPGTYLLANGDTLIEQQNVLRGAGAGATTIEPSGGGDALEDPNVTVVDATIAEPLQASEDEEEEGASQIDTKAQILAVIATLAILILILELVRRRRLVERYALLWMSAAIVLLVLSIWTDGLEELADLMGIVEPANAIFILAFAVAFLLLLNFSVATSRLSEETKILAQESARLEQELRAARGEVGTAESGTAQREAPSTRRTSDQ